MLVTKPKKRHRYVPFHRTSILVRIKSKHRLQSSVYPYDDKVKRKLSPHRLIKNIYQTYRSLWLTATFIFQLFVYLEKITRDIFTFIEKIIQIIRVIHGWIQMLASILSALHLIVSRLMMLISHLHRICQLLTILFRPFSNGAFENVVRSVSHFLFYYYSSNGACYTLQARTRHIVGRVRQRWKTKRHGLDDEEEEIYYDAFSDECDWF